MRKLRIALILALTCALPALGVQVASAQPAHGAAARSTVSPRFVCHDPLQPYIYPDPICPLVYAVTAPLCKRGCDVDSALAVREARLAARSGSPRFVCHDPLQPYLYPDPICQIVYLVTAPLCKSGCGVNSAVAALRENG